MKGMMVTREQNVGKNDSIGNKKKVFKVRQQVKHLKTHLLEVLRHVSSNASRDSTWCRLR